MIEILSERRYGEPKLNKPKEISGLKHNFSYEYNRKCKCPVFIVGDDIYIKHRDWCSITIYKGKLYDEWISKHSQKFVYNDTFGGVILRGECYIKLNGVLGNEKIVPILQQLALECIDDKSRFNSDDERMFNDVVTKAWRERWHK